MMRLTGVSKPKLRNYYIAFRSTTKYSDKPGRHWAIIETDFDMNTIKGVSDMVDHLEILKSREVYITWFKELS